MHPCQIVPARDQALSKYASQSSNPSPPVLTPAAPSTINKPLAPMPGSGNPPTISVKKQWILPPKPKPGRKPAADTPPTKRKAQNREAQRAFRERRAAKVGELEDEMKKMEEEDAREQDSLRERIKDLEINMEKMIETWRGEYNEMQIAYREERQLREQVEKERELLRDVMRNGTEAVPLPPRKEREKDYRSGQSNSGPGISSTDTDNELAEQVPIGCQKCSNNTRCQCIEDAFGMEHNENTNPNGSVRNSQLTENDLMTCGRCSTDTRCQCIEEAFEMGNIADDSSEPTFKRPHSPQTLTDNKRARQDFHIDEGVEIDFTSQYNARRPPNLPTTSSSSSSIAAIAPPDPCGFCSDDTPCICAEMAKERSHHQSSKAPPITTPSSSNPCINGPGTCAQCLSNPTSTLFCKTVAANRPSTTKNPTPATSIPVSASPQPQRACPTLTCADAFTTLSRHPAFATATNELNTWVPQLTPIAKPSSAPERTAFDIEAASVMSVLKLFDCRFGKQGEKASEGEAGGLVNGNGVSGKQETGSIAYESE